jgi:hypothetical protein
MRRHLTLLVLPLAAVALAGCTWQAQRQVDLTPTPTVAQSQSAAPVSASATGAPVLTPTPTNTPTPSASGWSASDCAWAEAMLSPAAPPAQDPFVLPAGWPSGLSAPDHDAWRDQVGSVPTPRTWDQSQWWIQSPSLMLFDDVTGVCNGQALASAEVGLDIQGAQSARALHMCHAPGSAWSETAQGLGPFEATATSPTVSPPCSPSYPAIDIQRAVAWDNAWIANYNRLLTLLWQLPGA